nr:uncharacterized protein LOC111515637 [Leptinotarsa decemlineata]
MKITSKTGLSPSPVKKIIRWEKVKTIQMRAITQPALFVLKPFAGLYNPYSPGCSFLCNHPADNTLKKSLRNARDNWVIEGKNLIADEQTNKSPFGEHSTQNNVNVCIPQVESVPEELFKRYTEKDSRPQTPAPTLTSAATRASNSRRCVTPDPSAKQKSEKTLLVLDLRRSHSQETIPFYGNSSMFQEPPPICIQQAPTVPDPSEDTKQEEVEEPAIQLSNTKCPATNRSSDTVNQEKFQKTDKKECVNGDSDEEFVRRRGKRRKKKGVESSRVPMFQASLDPETQVAAIGPESHNPSARHSLAQEKGHVQENNDIIDKTNLNIGDSSDVDINSYLDVHMLKQLRRELNENVMDTELNYKRRKALEEALKLSKKEKPVCDELINLQKQLKVPALNSKLWLSLPRSFSRSSVIFGLPMDSRMLSTLTPLEYLKDNVHITSSRKLLYNCIFNQYKIDKDDDIDYERRVSGKSLESCLNLVMGKTLTNQQVNHFRWLVNWKETDTFEFKTSCGIYALCERVLAPQICPHLPDRKADPCHEIEKADFQLLDKKLEGRQVNENLKIILLNIKEL